MGRCPCQALRQKKIPLEAGRESEDTRNNLPSNQIGTNSSNETKHCQTSVEDFCLRGKTEFHNRSPKLKIFFLFSQNNTVAGGVCYTSEHPTICHLFIIQIGLFFIIYSAADEFTSTCRAGTSATGRGKVYTCKFSSVKNVLVIRALNRG